MTERLSKLKKQLNKKSDKYNIGFSPIPEWIDTGNMALNGIISGDPRLGIPVGRSTMISGLQGTGKSFLAANAIKNAQEKGYFGIYLDTENSLSDGFMEKIGVDLSEDAFLPISVYSIEEVTELVADIMKTTEKEDKIFMTVDSLSNLETERDMDKFEEGKVAYGQGLKEKLYKQLVRNINSKIGHRNMACLFVTHMYVAGTDTYGNKILAPSCGSATLYLPSIGIELKKSNLKEGKEQIGISIDAKTYKTRYTSLGQQCSFDLPWDTGMDPYDGILPILEKCDFLNKNGGWYSYEHPETGEETKFQKTSMHKHIDNLLELYSGGEEPKYVEHDVNGEDSEEGEEDTDQ